MDPVILIILVFVGVLVVGGAAVAFLRGRTDHVPSIDPSTTDASDRIIQRPGEGTLLDHTMLGFSSGMAGGWTWAPAAVRWQ